MEGRRELGNGLLGLGARSGDISVSASAGSLSPYLNFDPSYLNVGNESQYIMPEGAAQRRGRFELAFSQIGSSVCAGGAVGGAAGLYQGIRETQQAALLASVRRTQLINSVAKKGASYAQSLGVVALMYSVFGVGISKLRGAEDELNTLGAATLTGLLYTVPIGVAKSSTTKSRENLRRMLRGGAAGFTLATVYCLYTSKDRLKQIVGIRD